MKRAQALAPRMPATFEAGRVIALADHALPDGNAYPLKATAVRKYIALAVDCSYPDRYKQRSDTTNPLERRREVPINAPPLVAYRAANCANADTLGLKRVLAAVPQFDEAAYALGNVVVWFAGETGGDDARKYYASAYGRFPRAAGITFMSGCGLLPRQRPHDEARSVGGGGCVVRLGDGVLRRQGKCHRGEDRAGA